MTLRLLTYNIQRGGVGRVDALARVINSCRPDLVVLQEATRPDVVEALAIQTSMREARSTMGRSVGFLSRTPVAHAAWHRPRFAHHAFVEIVPAGLPVRIVGVHLSAFPAAWTERRRMVETRALLAAMAAYAGEFHLIAGDFNTLGPGDDLDLRRLPRRYHPFVWLSGGRVRWRAIQLMVDAGYVDAFRREHPDEPGYTLPAPDPHVRLDYVFVPRPFADRVAGVDVVRSADAVSASDHLPVVADLVVG